MRFCYKRGHVSEGAAQAHVRGLLKIQELKPDEKQPQRLHVYICTRPECRNHPWHVGHGRRATR